MSDEQADTDRPAAGNGVDHGNGADAANGSDTGHGANVTSAGRIGRRVAILDGCRTPFAKSSTVFKDLTAIDLGTLAVRELLNRAEIQGTALDEVVYGTVVHSVKAPNIAREVALKAGIPARVPAFSVSRACASANQAITSAAEKIALGQGDVVLAGGAESLTNIPITVTDTLRDRLVEANSAKSTGQMLKAFKGFRPSELAPQTPAIAEYSTGETMGEGAEKMAKLNDISREEQDRWALRSHQLAAEGTEDGRLTAEITPVYLPPDYDVVVEKDNTIRTDTSMEKLRSLPPVFDRKYGSVTAGNSSPLTDGASAVLLMSEERAKAEGREPLGYIRSWAYAALDPREQLLQGPAFAVPQALDRAGLTMDDIDLWEMHEAFASQVLSNLQWLDSDAFARERLGRSEKVGILPEDRINVMGGSIAVGHPFGATGGRLTVTLLNEMKRRDAQFGLISVCAAGALGFAMVVERE
ncbi:MAG: acetyl-CoA C-acyltransferase FadI [Longimicrobiales bacterium]|nr:acetyl-CoA C-acyltransferase FadI [Longimicrobiales bacterium]